MQIIDNSLTYEERPVRILDRKVRSTRNKDVHIVKAIWSNHEPEEATSKAKDVMKKKYTDLFLEVNYEGVTRFL